MDNIQLYCGDCLEVMSKIPDKSIDAVITDPPYGTTACKWDSVIPLELMWEHLKRITKQKAAIVLTASQPFTTILIHSNIQTFKYCWIWEKPHAKGYFNAKKMPLRAHEDIVVFYHTQCTYNPQITYGHTRKTATKKKSSNSEVYGQNTKTVTYNSTSRYPRSIQTFKQDTQKSALHPTQKPVALMEYLIKTYTNEGETVLDFAMGSGTTGVACVETSRKFIGIEKDSNYFEEAKRRIETHKAKVPSL